jgi:hypothetical protein
MLRNHIKYCYLLLVLLTLSCAKRGTITGGIKDTIGPVLKSSFPKNFSTEFKGNTIRLTFDEYVKLKNASKQLIISPPMVNAPELTPSTASREITIKINDTLAPNTTYSFNFGQSIEDNNEGNPYKQFKYVFSTGSYIDSLSIGGIIKDAYSKKTDNFVSVLLYAVDETFNDSVIYKKKPRYITNTLDSLPTFKISNIKAGKYLLVALKDEGNNNKFNPKKDKIGFHKQFITVPNDTLFELELFKEKSAFKTTKPVQASGNRLIIGYEGNAKNLKANLINGNEVSSTIVTQFPKKDSVQVWFQPTKADSLNIAVTKDAYATNYSVKIKSQKRDTLSFTAKQSGNLPLREKFTLIASKPIVKIDATKIKITNKDSLAVTFTTVYDEVNQEVQIDFPVEQEQKYKFKIAPAAFTDYMGQTSDSLTYSVGTRSNADYGNLKVTLEQVKQFPLIVELTNDKGEVIAREFSDKNTTFDFNLLEPTLVTLRVIYDENNNKEWDPGNYLEKRQAEEVIYFPKDIDVRANWDVDQVFILSK